MAFRETARLKGSKDSYQVNENCKKYTLTDYGFTRTQKGNFEFNRQVKPSAADTRSVLFKISIDKEIEKLQMSLTNQSGLTALDIYNNDNYADFVESVEFLLADLVHSNILAKAE